MKIDVRVIREILSESQLIINTDQVVLVRERGLYNNNQVNVKKKKKKEKKKRKDLTLI